MDRGKASVAILEARGGRDWVTRWEIRMVWTLDVVTVVTSVRFPVKKHTNGTVLFVRPAVGTYNKFATVTGVLVGSVRPIRTVVGDV